MTKERSTNIVTFMIPGVLVVGPGHIRHIVKMHHLKKIFLLHSQTKIRQTKYKVMMTQEESTKIVNFMTFRAWGSCAYAWPYLSYSENDLFKKKPERIAMCKFHDPWSRGSCAWAWSYISSPLLVYTGINQAHVYNNDVKGKVYQNFQFHDPWGWVVAI